jgi:hypothetical protein
MAMGKSSTYPFPPKHYTRPDKRNNTHAINFIRNSIDMKIQRIYLHAFVCEGWVALGDPVLAHCHSDTEELLHLSLRMNTAARTLGARQRSFEPTFELGVILRGVIGGGQIESSQSVCLRLNTEVRQQVGHQGVVNQRCPKRLALFLTTDTITCTVNSYIS